MKPEIDDLPIRIRDAQAEDVPFIFNSWLKSFRSSNLARNISNTVYFAEHHKLIQEIVKSCPVLMAVNDKDPTEIYGWICAEEIDSILIVHYMYIKNTYRNLGLAKHLLNQFNLGENKGIVSTHSTRMGDIIAIKFNMVYNPYVSLKSEYRKKLEGSSEQKKEISKSDPS